MKIVLIVKKDKSIIKDDNRWFVNKTELYRDCKLSFFVVFSV